MHTFYKISGEYTMSTDKHKFDGVIRIDGKKKIEGYVDTVIPHNALSRKEIFGYVDEINRLNVILLSDRIEFDPVICVTNTNISSGIWFNKGIVVMDDNNMLRQGVFDIVVKKTDKDGDILLFEKIYHRADPKGCNGFCATPRKNCIEAIKTALAENCIA